VLSGTWGTYTQGANKYGPDFRYNLAGTGADQVQWQATITQSGDYDVYEWHQESAAQLVNDAPYTVNYTGGSQTIDVNQQTGGGQWNLLGTFYFAAGSRTITVSDQAQASRYVAADAVRWVWHP